MTHWSDGAIIDVASRQRFHRETTPIWLSTACTLLGARAPALDRPFRYAELGCGTGFHAAVVAATSPRAEVWGFDFNPANIEIARDLATRAGLANLHFMEVSFAALTAIEMPQFDFMVAEAVLSSVSPENQHHVHGLIGRLLRPGGLACLGYRADTGWAQFTPLQTLMRLLFEAGRDVSDFAATQIFGYLERLKAGGALYFPRNPILERRTATLRQRNPIDLAHELLGQDWHPLMFADVADAMAEVKCEFLGRATLHENIAAAAVPPGMLPLLDEAPSIRIRETMQDVAAATGYRRDIYRRGLVFMPVAEHHERLGAITVTAIDLTAPTMSNWPGQATTDLASYIPLIDALSAGSLTVAEAHALATLKDGTLEAAADAVAMLIAAGQVHPALPPDLVSEASGPVDRLNGAIIEAFRRGDEPGYLVSPLLGTAIEATALEALTVGALLPNQMANAPGNLVDRVQWAMRRGGRSVTRDGVGVSGEAEARAILDEEITRIIERRLPLLRALCIAP